MSYTPTAKSEKDSLTSPVQAVLNPESTLVQQLREQGGYQAQQQALKPSSPVQFLETSGGGAGSGETATTETTPAIDPAIPCLTGNPEKDAVLGRWWDELQNGVGLGYTAQMKAYQTQGSQWLYNFIQAGTKETQFGPIWQNSCEYLLARDKFHFLAKTADSAWRTWFLGKSTTVPTGFSSDEDSSHPARFSYDVKSPAAGNYNEQNLSDQSGIEYYPQRIGGYQNDTGVGVTEMCMQDPFMLRQIIIHEVQHDSDGHTLDAEGQYGSEFNALWLHEGDFSSTDFRGMPPSSLPGTAVAGIVVDGHSLDGFDSARQQAIFEYLHNSNVYPYIKQLWATASGRATITTHTQPTSPNPINSIRLSNLYNATGRYMELNDSDILEEIKSVQMKSVMEQVLGIASTLNQMDRDVLVGSATASLWNQRLSPLLTSNVHLGLQATIKAEFNRG